MKRKTLIGIICAIFILGGCSKEEILSQDKQVDLPEESKRSISIQMYVEKETSLGKYEPNQGVYLGVYAEKNPLINNDITEFEKQVSKPLTFRVFQYTSHNILSERELLQCMAQSKTPYIKLLMNPKDPFPSVYQMISDLKSEYDIPIFIELFPLTGTTISPQEYKDTFKIAQKAIKKHLKNSVIVWSVDLDRTYDMPMYYPGNKMVDWVGINAYIPRYKNNAKYNEDIVGNIDFWYKNFQSTKPMLVSGLAISHYSTIDHTYTIEDTKEKLDLFYSTFTDIYPRIKGILYIDVDMREVSQKGTEDYTVSSQKQLRDYLKSKFKEDKFLSKLEEEKDKTDLLPMKYDIPAVECNEKIYITKEYISTLFHKVPLYKIDKIQDLNGDEYYSLEDIARYESISYTEHFK